MTLSKRQLNYTARFIFSGCTEFSRSEEKDPACDLALTVFMLTWCESRLWWTDYAPPCFFTLTVPTIYAVPIMMKRLKLGVFCVNTHWEMTRRGVAQGTILLSKSFIIFSTTHKCPYHQWSAAPISLHMEIIWRTKWVRWLLISENVGCHVSLHGLGLK